MECKGGTLVGGIWRETSSRMRTMKLLGQVFVSCAASHTDRSTTSLHVCNYTLVRNGTPVPLRRVGRFSTLQGAALLHL